MLSDDGFGLAEGLAESRADDVVEGLSGCSAVGTATELVVALEAADEDAVKAVEDAVPEGVDGIGAVG